MILVIVVAIAFAMMVVERLWPARRLPPVRNWWPRALAINGAQIVIVVVAGATWERWLGGHVWHVAKLGFGAELAIGYAVIVVWLYWTHRARHQVDVLWRWLHQLHHSPARVEVLTAFYKHPLEIVSESILASLIFYAVLGISRDAALVISNASGVLGLFYHWNVRTPRWIGYLVQRPESHCVHHQLGVHAYNYSELPLVDMLFGTFKNPKSFVGQCGLGADRELRFGELLRGTDVTKSR